MAVETDPIGMATSEILSSNRHVNIVAFCSTGDLYGFVLIFLVGNCFTVMGR